MPFDVVPTYEAWPGLISITTKPPACRRMSPVITAAGHTALVSAKYSVPPPHTCPAPAEAFGGQTNSNRLPFCPRSVAAVAVHVLPAGPVAAAGFVAVAPGTPVSTI